jgi:hypothetical protein
MSQPSKQKKIIKHGSALADEVHEGYVRSCKKRGLPVYRRFGEFKERRKR